MDEETIRLTTYRIWEQQGKPDGQVFFALAASQSRTDARANR
ncbi:DUF2934 domain-containing protein [uncultured Pseudomonas sp.]|nr:DUF2934 domain-containing protein [uncultured Pseudomonas sp.]